MLVATAPTGMWPTKRFESPNRTKPLVPSLGLWMFRGLSCGSKCLW